MIMQKHKLIDKKLTKDRDKMCNLLGMENIYETK